MVRVCAKETYDNTKHDYAKSRVVLDNENPFKPEDANATHHEAHAKQYTL